MWFGIPLHPGAHVADKDNTLIPYIPPEWDDEAMAKHPHSSDSMFYDQPPGVQVPMLT